ncbi:major facilitator superfamily domain-containing protein [Mycena vulgaris]|nr:major facilitator superfamily domain-containing protein [Mycena vulgaris]
MPCDETTVLISPPKRIRTPTPLPKLQLAIIMLVQICEPIASQSIYPYINQLLRELDIAPNKIGYYALVVRSDQWSRASDRVGRKKILLMGLFGTALSMLCFGLSRTFWTFVLSRCLTGLLNGNTDKHCVMKSVMGDLTDASNRAEGFAYLPDDASLSHPHERFPETFPGPLWSSFPYFLPCAATGAVILSTFVVVLVLFKETVPQQRRKSLDDDFSVTPRGPLPLRDLLTVSVVISVSNHVALGFLHTTFVMPVEFGGLGLPPSKIGLILAVDDAVTGIFQMCFFAKLVRRFGERRVFMNGLAAFLPIFSLFPVMSIVARWPGWNPAVWILVGCLIVLDALMNPSYGAMHLHLHHRIGSKCSRGTINGISQTSASVARAVGPALATSLFSLSAAHNILGGYMVYAVFFIIATLMLLLAARLPEQVWEDCDEDF